MCKYTFMHKMQCRGEGTVNLKEHEEEYILQSGGTIGKGKGCDYNFKKKLKCISMKISLEL